MISINFKFYFLILFKCSSFKDWPFWIEFKPYLIYGWIIVSITCPIQVEWFPGGVQVVYAPFSSSIFLLGLMCPLDKLITPLRLEHNDRFSFFLQFFHVQSDCWFFVVWTPLWRDLNVNSKVPLNIRKKIIFTALKQLYNNQNKDEISCYQKPCKRLC